MRAVFASHRLAWVTAGVCGTAVAAAQPATDAGDAAFRRGIAGARLALFGTLPGGTDDSAATRLSPNGTFLVGRAGTTLGEEDGTRAFLWVDNGTRVIDPLIDVGADPIDSPLSSASAISNGGETVVGLAQQPDGNLGGIVWLDALTLPPPFLITADLPGFTATSTRDVDAAGEVIAGDISLGPFPTASWAPSPAEPLRPIDALPDNTFFSSATAVSDDGRWMTGQLSTGGSFDAFRWRVGTGNLTTLPVAPGALPSALGNAIADDGDVVAGTHLTSTGNVAFRWDHVDGTVLLGSLPGGSPTSDAVDLNADGTVIVGASESELGSRAYLWTYPTGMIDLNHALEGRGVDLGGAILIASNSVSADGARVAGLAAVPREDNPGEFRQAAFVADLPDPVCLAIDSQEPFGTLNLLDVNTFLIGFGNQQRVADIAEPYGTFDLADIQDFLIGFSTCPTADD